jgi:hypothetical protein
MAVVLIGAAMVGVGGGCRDGSGRADRDARPQSSQGSRSGQTTAAQPATPSVPAEPVTAALLPPPDFGPGYAINADAPGDPGGMFAVLVCPRWTPPAEGAAAHAVATAQRTYDAPRGHTDELDVLRYADRWAAGAMTEIRDALAACARFEAPGDPGVTVRTAWTVLATAFAGDESVAVRQQVFENDKLSNVDFHVAVRRGDVVAYAWLSDQRWTEDDLRALGRRMAEGLCAAIDAC